MLPPILILIFLVNPSRATEWFVGPDGNDRNPGTLSEPFAHFSKATQVIKPADTVTFLDGIHREDNRVLGVSGTADAWITIRAQNRGKALLTVSGDAIDSSVLFIGGANYIRVFGIEMRGSQLWNAKGSSGIAVERSHHVTIEACIVHDCAGGGISFCGSGSVNGVDTAGVNDFITIQENTVYRCAYYNRYLCSGISIYQARSAGMGSDPSGFNIIIKNNICYANANLITFMNDPDKPSTDGNGIIYDDSRNSQSSAGSALAGIYPHRTLIENNICYNNGGRGIHVFCSDHVIVRNNTCWNNSMVLATGQWKSELSNALTDDTRWTNNVAIAPADGVTSAFAGKIYVADKVLSLFEAQTEKSPIGSAYEGNMLIGPYALDHSRLPDESAGGSRYATRETAIEQHNITTKSDAMLISPNADPASADFCPSKDSPLIDAGTSRAGDYSLLDITGLPRPQGIFPDIGAFEMSPTIPH